MRKCRVCKGSYEPRNSLQMVCGIACAIAFARKRDAARTKAKAAQERKELREAKERIKTRHDHVREAQAAFNAYIRERDYGLPCICCGRLSTGYSRGGEWDAGHYRSRGSAPHLRFDERNVHAQLKQCNRYDSGNPAGYRMGLIERIGLAAVEALEADQEPRKPTIEELKEIKRHYTAEAKRLRKEREQCASAA